MLLFPMLYNDVHVYLPGDKVLTVERLDLFDALLNLCAYRHPENITLPEG